MVYYGKGFSWTELYDMPVWLRKFYYKKIIEDMEQNAKASENQKNTKNAPKKKVVRPGI